MAKQILPLRVSFLLEVTWKSEKSFLDVDLIVGKLFSLTFSYGWISEAITSASTVFMVLSTLTLASIAIFRVIWNITYSVLHPCSEMSDRLFNSLGFQFKAITGSKSILA